MFDAKRGAVPRPNDARSKSATAPVPSALALVATELANIVTANAAATAIDRRAAAKKLFGLVMFPQIEGAQWRGTVDRRMRYACCQRRSTRHEPGTTAP